MEALKALISRLELALDQAPRIWEAMIRLEQLYGAMWIASCFLCWCLVGVMLKYRKKLAFNFNEYDGVAAILVLTVVFMVVFTTISTIGVFSNGIPQLFVPEATLIKGLFR